MPEFQLAALLGFLGLVLLAGGASASVASVNLHGWYAALRLPPFAPLNPLGRETCGLLAVFYLMTAIAAWRAWRRVSRTGLQRAAMIAWGWQLALSAAWPAVFFGFHATLAASVIAAALVFGIGLTIRRFARLDAAAAVLLVPYLACAGFAGYLSAGFWWLNH